MKKSTIKPVVVPAEAWIYCHDCRACVYQAMVSSKYNHGVDTYRCAKRHTNKIKLSSAHHDLRPAEFKLDLPTATDIKRMRDIPGESEEVDFYMLTTVGGNDGFFY